MNIYPRYPRKLFNIITSVSEQNRQNTKPQTHFHSLCLEDIKLDVSKFILPTLFFTSYVYDPIKSETPKSGDVQVCTHTRTQECDIQHYPIRYYTLEQEAFVAPCAEGANKLQNQ
jgi:hypothetical protein